jgi:hypothetical protein
MRECVEACRIRRKKNLSWILAEFLHKIHITPSPAIEGNNMSFRSLSEISLRNTVLYNVKKGFDFPVPSREVTNQTLHGRE